MSCDRWPDAVEGVRAGNPCPSSMAPGCMRDCTFQGARQHGQHWWGEYERLSGSARSMTVISLSCVCGPVYLPAAPAPAALWTCAHAPASQHYTMPPSGASWVGVPARCCCFECQSSFTRSSACWKEAASLRDVQPRCCLCQRVCQKGAATDWAHSPVRRDGPLV